MGKIGKYTYPEESLGDIIKYLYKIKDFFGENTVSGELPREAIAEAWNLRYRSGTFNTRIASLIHYGFAERARAGTIKLTKLAMDILYPEPMSNLDQEAKRKAFFNIQLFRDLYEQLGESPTVEQVKWFLRQKSNAEPPIVEKKAPEIHKIYIESVTEISTKKEQEKLNLEVCATPEGGEDVLETKVFTDTIQPTKQMTQKSEEVEELKFGNVRIFLPPTREGVEIAKSLIELFEKTMLKERQNKEAPKSKEE